MAETLSLLGTCDRAHVGAIIIKEGRAVSWGYNGAPPGMPHCEDNDHGWRDFAHDAVLRNQVSTEVDRREWIDAQLLLHGCRNTTHAEANAIAFAARQGISTDGAQMFTTVSPCETCAKLIIAAGITDVHYITEYRDVKAIALLDRAHVYTHHHGD
jgi:dCMP deaminase